MKTLLKLSTSIFSCLLIGLLAGFYWYQLTYYPSTDNAYVKANIIHIAPSVSGTIDQVLVNDNESVKKGQLLYTIDKRPFQIALKKANSALALAKQAHAANFEAVESAKASVLEREAELHWATLNFKRVQTLVTKGRASVSSGDKAKSDYLIAKSSLKKAESLLSEAIVQLGAPDAENAAIQSAKASVLEALLNLDYTDIRAPADGVITHLSLNPGDMAIASHTNVSIISPDNFWIEANFTETQMQNIKTGQIVTITLDMYPNQTLTGKIDSISRSTGQTFALIPQENAGGNWVKVTQRIPIKITLNNADNVTSLLKVGASARVSVNAKT